MSNFGTSVNFISSRRRIRPTSTLQDKMNLFWNGELKGFAVSSYPSGGSGYIEKDFSDLRDTGANVVRVPLTMTKNVGGTFYDFPETDVQYVEKVLNWGIKYKFKVIVVLVPLPAGQAYEFWDNSALRADISTKWVAISNRIKNNSALIAYDIINEPVAVEYTLARKNEWFTHSQAIASAIRAEDPNTPIIVEPTWWALPGSFWQTSAISLTGLVSSFHMYEPQTITHQGINGYPGGVAYPGGAYNKAQLYIEMVEARKFSAQFNVPMFVGEFSCIRWTPGNGSEDYHKDVISLFEDAKWGWTYHAWRDYEGWDLEIPTNIAQGSGTPATRTNTSSRFLRMKEALFNNPPIQ